MQAIAAASRIPLVEGTESLTLIPATAGLEAIGHAMDTADTVVAYKGGRQLADLLEVVRAHDREGMLGVNLGLPEQELTPLAELDIERAPYFSTVLLTPRRGETGGRL